MIDAEGGISEVVKVDVTDEESCKNAVAKTIQLFGTIHILVNIGQFPRMPSSDIIINDGFSQLGLVVQWAMQLTLIWQLGIATSESMSLVWF
jgi:NAD(P)-dependent dehydrogenase (short-subunit alcohol dehydrogenase family)